MSANRTRKAERRAAKRDAIRWSQLARWSARNGHPVAFNDPPPRTSIADWARRRRAVALGEPVRLSVKINICYEPNQLKEG